MADTAVRLLACLHLVQAITPHRVPDNAVGYSRIVVATPGMRRYTYDISHDPHGRDFSINFSPLDTELDLNNFLPEPEGRFLLQAAPEYHHVIPINENEEIQLQVKHPTHEEMEKSSRAIQTVHAAYSKKPPQPQTAMLEDFDLGIMGYGDFMDSHEEPRANHQPYPVQNSPAPQPLGRFTPNYGFRQHAYLPQPKTPYSPKKLVNPKLGPQKGHAENPQVQYNTPLNFQRALFVPAFDEGRLNGLADKAYSKVFMAHGFSKPAPRFYPKNVEESEGIDVAKTLFVPVVIVPSTQQTLVGEQNIDRSSSAAFEPRKIIKKRA